MKNLILLMAMLWSVSMIGCASTPIQKRRAATIDCIKGFMHEEAHITDASKACRYIYRAPARAR